MLHLAYTFLWADANFELYDCVYYCRLITIAADDQEVTLNVLSQIVPLTEDVGVSEKKKGQSWSTCFAFCSSTDVIKLLIFYIISHPRIAIAEVGASLRTLRLLRWDFCFITPKLVVLLGRLEQRLRNFGRTQALR